MRIVLVTGGFDPLHSGHIEYFKEAKKLGDVLHVGINSDEWLERKKGKAFLPFKERATIIESLECVDKVLSFDDSDGTACGAIYKTMATNTFKKIIFANGGDREKENIPEYKVYGGLPKVEFAFGVGGTEKKNSSSWILAKWPGEIIERPWGWYRVIDQGLGYKVKELEINPDGKLSMQRHKHRAERWNVVQGACTMITEYDSRQDTIQLNAHCTPYTVDAGVWHQACNNTTKPCKVIEVQIGDSCEESDIERKDD